MALMVLVILGVPIGMTSDSPSDRGKPDNSGNLGGFDGRWWSRRPVNCCDRGGRAVVLMVLDVLVVMTSSGPTDPCGRGNFGDLGRFRGP